MAANEVHIGDTGTRFTLTFYDDTTLVDVSAATTKQILFLAPDGGLLTKTATFTTDGSDGKIYYDSLAADFDEKGVWCWQGRVVTPSGEWWSDVASFEVYPNLTA